MITTIQIKIKKQLPFNANQIEKYFEEKGINVLRWAIVKVTEKEFIIDAGIIQ
ncbi:hypothetical protein IJG14_02045 [bacterium]|nr:hypothetical protein [bacterium]